MLLGPAHADWDPELWVDVWLMGVVRSDDLSQEELGTLVLRPGFPLHWSAPLILSLFLVRGGGSGLAIPLRSRVPRVSHPAHTLFPLRGRTLHR
jgi:hypothetical protein